MSSTRANSLRETSVSVTSLYFADIFLGPYLEWKSRIWATMITKEEYRVFQNNNCYLSVPPVLSLNLSVSLSWLGSAWLALPCPVVSHRVLLSCLVLCCVVLCWVVFSCPVVSFLVFVMSSRVLCSTRQDKQARRATEKYVQVGDNINGDIFHRGDIFPSWEMTSCDAQKKKENLNLGKLSLCSSLPLIFSHIKPCVFLVRLVWSWY